MAYSKRTWVNKSFGLTTPIDAAALNHLETQYDEALADAKEYTDSEIAGLNLSGNGLPAPVEEAVDGQVLTADSEAAGGVKWADAAGGGGAIAANEDGGYDITEGSTASSTRSIAVGEGANASEGNAIAIGYSSMAGGGSAVAIGDTTLATAEGAVAIGWFSEANAINALAVGEYAIADGKSGTAVGDVTRAGGEGSTAIGWAAEAPADRATSLGGSSDARGIESLAAGFASRAEGEGASAIGWYTYVGSTHAHSTALGYSATTTKANQVRIGRAVDEVSVPGRLNVAPRTPSGSTDTQGSVGDIAADDNYVYVKTSTGWKRAALSAW